MSALRMSGYALKTRRLVIGAVTAEDLDGLVDVRRSNPEYLARTEASDGVVGRYDRSMLERDLAVAAMDHASADEDHPIAHRFLGSVGFVEVDRGERRGPAGRVPVVVHQRTCK